MALNDADLFLVNQNGQSKKITYANLKSNINTDEALWELDGTTIQPKEDTHKLEIGGGDIELNADGSALFDGSITFRNWDNNGTSGAVINGGSDNAFLFVKGTYNPASAPNGNVAFAIRNGGTGGDKSVVEMKTDGSAEFANKRIAIDGQGHISTFGTAGSGGSSQLDIAAEQPGNGARSLIRARTGSTGLENGTIKWEVFDDGSSVFADTVSSGSTGRRGQFRGTMDSAAGSATSAEAFACFYNGTKKWSVTYDGIASQKSIILQLGTDEPANYTTTTDSEGNETQVYNGPTLDVKERVLNLVARLDALEANEMIDDAVDTSLLSLLASASARLDSIEARLAALEGGN